MHFPTLTQPLDDPGVSLDDAGGIAAPLLGAGHGALLLIVVGCSPVKPLILGTTVGPVGVNSEGRVDRAHAVEEDGRASARRGLGYVLVAVRVEAHSIEEGLELTHRPGSARVRRVLRARPRGRHCRRAVRVAPIPVAYVRFRA